jgi:hypothetical protein
MKLKLPKADIAELLAAEVAKFEEKYPYDEINFVVVPTDLWESLVDYAKEVLRDGD